MTVKDIMTKNPLVLQEDETFEQTLRKLNQYRVKGFPVINKKQEIMGVVSEKDLIDEIFPKIEEGIADLTSAQKRYREIRRKKIGDFMSAPAMTVDQNKPVMEAIAMMIFARIHRLPVVDNKNCPIGIITRGDIFRALQKKI